MGYMRHHAIVVSSSLIDLEPIRAAAIDLGLVVTHVSHGAFNGYESFCVVPDGSKEGWGESRAADEGRTRLVQLMESFRYDDGSMPVDYAEVQFGDGNHESKMLRHSDLPWLREPHPPRPASPDQGASL